MQILLVEDEPKIAAFIQKGLTEYGYELTTAYDGKSGLAMALQGDYNLIILDIMVPLINGIEICKQIREKGVDTPVLMLTALGTTDDKVLGLQSGADDYLTKPFHFKEFLARIQALTRRQVQQTTTNNILKIADLVLDRSSKSVHRDHKEIVLTAKEYTLLELFMENQNRLLTRSVIGEHVWGYEFDSNSNVIDVYISYLRNKIDKGFSCKLIHTIVNMGYIMKEK